jgi:decaprenyl-phosphate phosphoribosyltransferase
MSTSVEGRLSSVAVAPARSVWAARLALLRIPQWTKSAFVIAPVFFSRKFVSLDAVATSIAAALAFALVASVVYTFNDYHDRVEDSHNPQKRLRPLASRELGLWDAVLLGALCAILAGVVGLLAGLPTSFWIIISVYLAMQVAYSTFLRSVVLVDVAVIAAGFVLRILAGTTALKVEASSFIVLASGLLALLLALGKRRGDLNVETAGERPSLSGYNVEFIDLSLACLAAAVIAFYAQFTVSGYSVRRFGETHLYLTTFVVAIGVIRYLQVIIVEKWAGSPTDVVLHDRALQAIIACWIAMYAVIAYT